MKKVLALLTFVAGIALAILVEFLFVLFAAEVVADIDLKLREALGIALYTYVLSHGVAGLAAKRVLD